MRVRPVEPAPRRNKVLAFVRSGLRDISVSRPAARAGGWGIPVPGDPEQVIHVWWDALANYVTALGDDAYFQRWWPGSTDALRWWLLREIAPVCAELLGICHVLAGELRPFLPSGAERLLAQLGSDGPPRPVFFPRLRPGR
ncbi:class I tRNA ligase family protein [Actinoplanes sp. NPDC049118]|uniref:class I tRNA ligase family protein n=1 Tax=Actinoplanes sp. NPDC049118 TaxID=3155769 RepID=UPI00341013C4